MIGKLMSALRFMTLGSTLTLFTIGRMAEVNLATETGIMFTFTVLIGVFSAFDKPVVGPSAKGPANG